MNETIMEDILHDLEEFKNRPNVLNKINEYIATLKKNSVKANPLEQMVRQTTQIRDRNGKMIYFGDTVRFADKVEWYRSEYTGKLLLGMITKKDALKEINAKPYEERLVENVQDYEWLLSSEIQIYWEVIDVSK